MERHIVKIKSIEKITHDVLRIVAEKPASLSFIPGQATEISINKPEWKDEKRPFTFTCLPNRNYIEFTIKTYPSHNAVTNQLLQLHKDDELILHDVFGDIHYKGEGVFIAGGAGVTPFISIFRQLEAENKTGMNKLIFANKAKADIILEDEFKHMLGDRFINILSDEEIAGYAHGFITEEFLKPYISDRSLYIYVCGPPPMMDALDKIFKKLHIDEERIIKESF
jgi:ferredoxin-NADP reductase